MANYQGTGRSNYFAVKDIAVFQQLMDTFGVHYETNTSSATPLIALFGDDESGHLPDEYELEDELVNVDICEVIVKHLRNDQVFIWKHSGHEKLRYVEGYSFWLNAEGNCGDIKLNDIIKLAQQANPDLTITYPMY